MSPRAVLVVAAAATLGLLVYAASLLRGGDPPAPADPAAEGAPDRVDDDRPLSPRERSERDGDRDALARALRTRLERALEAPEPQEPPLPPSQSRLEAETAFEVVMEELEQLADAETPLSRRRRARLYRYANDTFSALTNQLDPNSARDMQALEDAHVRLKTMLGELDVAPPRPPRPPGPMP